MYVSVSELGYESRGAGHQGNRFNYTKEQAVEYHMHDH